MTYVNGEFGARRRSSAVESLISRLVRSSAHFLGSSSHRLRCAFVPLFVRPRPEPEKCENNSSRSPSRFAVGSARMWRSDGDEEAVGWRWGGTERGVVARGDGVSVVSVDVSGVGVVRPPRQHTHKIANAKVRAFATATQCPPADRRGRDARQLATPHRIAIHKTRKLISVFTTRTRVRARVRSSTSLHPPGDDVGLTKTRMSTTSSG